MMDRRGGDTRPPKEVHISVETMHISIRDGEVHDAGSWLYAWVSMAGGKVIYVGATGLPPALRTWLHLHHEDPTVARLAARYPAVSTEPLEVIACSLPEDVDRRTAKAELILQLHNRELLAADYVGDRPRLVGASDQVPSSVTAVVDHLVSTLASC